MASSKDKLVVVVYSLQVEVGDFILEWEGKVQSEVKLTAVSNVMQGRGSRRHGGDLLWTKGQWNSVAVGPKIFLPRETVVLLSIILKQKSHAG